MRIKAALQYFVGAPNIKLYNICMYVSRSKMFQTNVVDLAEVYIPHPVTMLLTICRFLKY
jgi:hypothetical protein